jgi:hypothetical protein
MTTRHKKDADAGPEFVGWVQTHDPIVGFEVNTVVVVKIFISGDLAPCSPLKVNRLFGGRLSVTCFMLIFSLACSSTMDMMATCSSESSVDFQQATRSYNTGEKSS